MRIFHLIAMTIALMAAGGAFAADLPIPPPPAHTTAKQPPQKEIPVQANQPHCVRWTDECVSCTRGDDGGAPVCSNAGIACQPKAIRCLGGDTQQDEKPK